MDSTNNGGEKETYRHERDIAFHTSEAEEQREHRLQNKKRARCAAHAAAEVFSRSHTPLIGMRPCETIAEVPEQRDYYR